MRAVNGIWFEDVIWKYMQKKKQNSMYVFDDVAMRQKSVQTKHDWTAKIIASKKFNVYYQPYFCYQNYVTKCDLLFDRGKNGFDLYEIKAVNQINTKKRKKDFNNDLLYQCWILDKLGYRIRNVYILHLNHEYSLQDKLDVNQLFKVDDSFSEEVIAQIKINKETKIIDQLMIKAWTYLQNDFITMQTKLLDQECQEENLTYCTHIIKKVKSKYNWLQLYRLQRGLKAKFYLKNFGKEIDLENIDFSKFTLSERQLRSIKVIQGLENVVQSKDKVHAQLKQYQFPIYFYDFETINTAIPRFKDTKPWMQIPFQYSIHILTKTDNTLQHCEYLSQTRNDPRQDFIKSFLRDMQKYGPGSYVVYNVAFERMILKSLLASVHLTNQEKIMIENLITKTLDLMDFFKEFNIYHKNFYGSLSIKKTLPALISDFENSYRKLKIQKGDQASAYYFNYLHDLIDETTWIENAQHLLQYCKLDSLAMVKIYQKINTMVNHNDK